MPIYDYACAPCGASFEPLRHRAEADEPGARPADRRPPGLTPGQAPGRRQ